MSLLDLSLFNCLQHQDQLKQKIWLQASLQVINYYPRYLNNLKSLDYSNYYYVKHMLYHLFIDQPDLLLVKNKTYRSYIKAFQAYKQLYTHLEDFYNNLEGDSLDLDLDLGNKDLQDKAENKHPLANFKAFACQRPGVDFMAYRDMLNSLESQEIDCLYNQSTYIK